MTYTAEAAHADGRHASRHPEDRAFWRAVCTSCRRCTCGGRDFASCLCGITPQEYRASREAVAR